MEQIAENKSLSLHLEEKKKKGVWGGGENKLSQLIISVGSLSGTLMFFLGVTIRLSVAQLERDVTRIKKKKRLTRGTVNQPIPFERSEL